MIDKTITRPALRYFGGKYRIAEWIISHFPPHGIYVEPYAGGASVLMRKARSHSEIYNDLDSEIVNVFRMMRDHAPALKHLLEWTPFSRDEFKAAYETSEDPLEQARRTIIRSFMGHGADGTTKQSKTGFRGKSSHNRGQNAAQDWKNWIPQIELFRQRLHGVVIENRDALEVIAMQDTTETLFYVDPPYVHSTRTREGRKGYRHEMTDPQHNALIQVLKSVKGMVVLSGYENEIYSVLADWPKFTRETYADGGRDRTETIWMNPAAARRQRQTSLF